MEQFSYCKIVAVTIVSALIGIGAIASGFYTTFKLITLIGA